MDCALQCDTLLGYESIITHNISGFPAFHVVTYVDALYLATDNPVSVLRVILRRAHFEQSPLPAAKESISAVSVLPQVAMSSLPPVSVPLHTANDALPAVVDSARLCTVLVE